MRDLVDRDAIMESVTKEYNRRRTGDGLKLAWIEKAVNAVPSAQPKTAKRTTETAQNVPNDDLISRKMAIEAVNTALFPKINTAKDAEKALRGVPSAQPEIIYCRDCVFYEGENPCGIVDWWNEASDYCSKGMRREDG